MYKDKMIGLNIFTEYDTAKGYKRGAVVSLELDDYYGSLTELVPKHKHVVGEAHISYREYRYQLDMIDFPKILYKYLEEKIGDEYGAVVITSKRYEDGFSFADVLYGEYIRHFPVGGENDYEIVMDKYLKILKRGDNILYLDEYKRSKKQDFNRGVTI